jgi:hypothetical protein
MDIAESDDDLDLVWGAEAIGKVIKASPRKTFHLLERGLIPATKIGAQWVSSRSGLRAHLLKAIKASMNGGA